MNRLYRSPLIFLGSAALIILLNAVGCAPSAPRSVATGADSSRAGGAKTSGALLPWQSGGLKIAYIRSDVISSEYAEYKDAEAALRNQNRKWMEEVERMEADARRKETELDDLALILSEDRKTELLAEIAKLRDGVQKFRNDVWYDENGQYVKRRKELMEPIDARVNEAIWKVCEDRGLDMVFDTIAGNIVYVKPGLDITQEVLDELK